MNIIYFNLALFPLLLIGTVYFYLRKIFKLNEKKFHLQMFGLLVAAYILTIVFFSFQLKAEA
jgi:hypothetical protein